MSEPVAAVRPDGLKPLVMILVNDAGELAIDAQLPAEQLKWLFDNLSLKLLTGRIRMGEGSGLVVPQSGNGKSRLAL